MAGHKWQPGETGNPNGRPVKNRALTAILERAGSKSLIVAGKRTSGKQWLGHALWELVTTSKVTMPDGSAMQVEPKDWLDIVKWLYGHVDGPPRQSATGKADDPIYGVVNWVQFVQGAIEDDPDAGSSSE